MPDLLPARVQNAARAAQRARHQQILTRPGFAETLTINDDYTDRVSDVASLIRVRRPLGAGVQEGKGKSYDALLGPRYGVQQDLTSPATAGVAVVWDKQQADALGAEGGPGRRGHGWSPIIEPRRGDSMLTRGVVWQDLRVIATGYEFRLASYHRPPGYLDHLWPDADMTFLAWLRVAPLPVHCLTDNNSRRLSPLIHGTRFRWRHAGIDGSIGDVRVRSTYALTYGQSDHRPVSQAIDVRDR